MRKVLPKTRLGGPMALLKAARVQLDEIKKLEMMAQREGEDEDEEGVGKEKRKGDKRDGKKTESKGDGKKKVTFSTDST